MAKPSIVFATKHYPCPKETYGAQLRAYYLSQALKEVADLTFWIFPYGPVPEETVTRSQDEYDNFRTCESPVPCSKNFGKVLSEQLNPMCATIGKQFPAPSDQKTFLQTVEESDLVWFHGSVIPNLFGRSHWENSILDIDDIPSQVWDTRAIEARSVGARVKALRQRSLWRQREQKLTTRFSQIAVCSTEDKKYLGGSSQVQVIPNGFAKPQHKTERSSHQHKRIGFIGKLDYAPNRKGVEWFLQEVWPKVLAKHPDAEFRMVGSNSQQHFQGAPNTSSLGFVEDVDQEMASWSSSIVPIQTGGGTRIKIAEAFSKHCPIVSTSLGAYGYDLTSGQQCLLADSSKEFAQACIDLLESPEKGQQLAENAYQEFLENWDWAAISKQVQETALSALKMSYA